MYFKKIITSLLLISTLIPTISFAACYKDLENDTDYSIVKVNKQHSLNNTIVGKKGNAKVIEFFWYGCPHCYDAEPYVKKYVESHKDSVTFVRYPVSFPGWESGSKLYFTLEAMGLADKLHSKVFDVIHKEHKNIMVDEIARKEFLEKEKVDVKVFNSFYNSFSMNVKLNQSKEIAKGYQLTSSPTFFINDMYSTGPGMTKSLPKTFEVIDAIVQSSRRTDTSCRAK